MTEPKSKARKHHTEKHTVNNSKGNGLGGLLTTLASSGDNWVKLVIVGGLFYNTVVTQRNNSEIKTNTTGIQTNEHSIQGNSDEISRFRKVAAQQLKVVFDNQRVLGDFMDEQRASQDRIQTKLGIPHPPYQPYPRQEVPDYGTSP